MDSDSIEITISIPRDKAASLTFGARAKWLGQLVEEQLTPIIPPRPMKGEGGLRNRWKPYTREGVAQAFADWASLHDGKAPSKNDWSESRDPEGRWPRASSDSFKGAVVAMAEEEGLHLSTWAPCRLDPEQRNRRLWHETKDLRVLDDGRVESVQDNYILGSKVEEFAQRWQTTPEELADIEEMMASPDPGPYCLDCFHGSGCRPADMSYWTYAVEIIGSLRPRTGGDTAATRSMRDDFGRNRQMVTGGVADVHLSPSDPAARAVIETIDAR